MTSVRDARDAQLGGKAIYEQWRDDFELLWLDITAEEMILEAVGDMMERIPPEVHDKLREMDPQAYDETMDLLEGGRNASRLSGK